jgi:alpha-L-rhamnosidase
MKPAQAEYIWPTGANKGRNLFGLFRRSFDLAATPASARIQVFADTIYQLFINGSFVDFGPARFDPRFPLYDTLDIGPFLIRGKNVIAVRVNYDGGKNFKSIPAQAGFIAWGEVRGSDNQVVTLDTNGEDWKSVRCGAHLEYAPKLSFILNAAERFDQAGEEEGWTDPDFDDRHWGLAVPVADQNAWGDLQPRLIPQMSKAPVSVPAARLQPLLDITDRFAFTLPLPHYYDPDNNLIGIKDAHLRVTPVSRFLVFSTWIHSPEAQTVHAGVYWGDWGVHGKAWLNGAELPSGYEQPNKSMYRVQTWNLKKGWNRYFGNIDLYHDELCQAFEVLKSAGISFCAEPELRSDHAFKHSPILTAQQFAQFFKDKPLPYGPEETLADVGGWVYVEKARNSLSPCLATSWDRYGETVVVLAPEQLEGRRIPVAEYPHGFSLLFDFGWMHLVLPILRLSGVRGATIDITFSESLKSDQDHLQHTHYHAIGDRVKCSRDRIEWLPPQPRGGRYMRLTVRDNRQDVVIESVRFLSANYPVEAKGSFDCSDPLLTVIWHSGKLTQMACMEDAFIDCAGRERGLYIRDSIIQYKVNQAVFGDHALMRRCLQLFGQSPDATGKFRAVYPTLGDYTIADFSLNLLEGYDDYYSQTGDLETVQRDWATIRGNLKWFNELADEREDLLLDADWNKRRGFDSIYGGFHGDLAGKMDKTGINCAFSCMYLTALECAARLGALIDACDDVAEYRRRAEVLKRSIPDKFWDPAQQCYADNLTRATHSVQTNLIAIRSGVVRPAQMPSIKQYLKREMVSVFTNGYDPTDGILFSPSFGFYLIDGLYRAGMPDVAERMIGQGWGWALAQGLKTVPEYFSLKHSLCHAWSACPTYYLSRYLLGIHFPQAPDMSVVGIDIRTDDIAWARGTYPHPSGGVIEIAWHLEEGKRIFDRVNVPAGMTVLLPKEETETTDEKRVACE